MSHTDMLSGLDAASKQRLDAYADRLRVDREELLNQSLRWLLEREGKTSFQVDVLRETELPELPETVRKRRLAPIDQWRLLLLEDDLPTLHTLQLMMANRGLNVVCVKSVEEAFTWLREEGPVDMLITDIRMPGQRNGLDFIHAVRQGECRPQDVGVYIVALSALAFTGERLAGLFSGADYYFVKPFMKEDLDEIFELGARHYQERLGDVT